MDTIQFLEVTDAMTNEVSHHVIIDHGNSTFTSMLKSTYDKLKANE